MQVSSAMSSGSAAPQVLGALSSSPSFFAGHALQARPFQSKSKSKSLSDAFSFTNDGFSLKTGKLYGAWNFNNPLSNFERPQYTGYGEYKSFRSGPQNDAGVIFPAGHADWKVGGAVGGDAPVR